jgi:hypothetical protein
LRNASGGMETLLDTGHRAAARSICVRDVGAAISRADEQVDYPAPARSGQSSDYA